MVASILNFLQSKAGSRWFLMEKIINNVPDGAKQVVLDAKARIIDGSLQVTIN